MENAENTPKKPRDLSTFYGWSLIIFTIALIFGMRTLYRQADKQTDQRLGRIQAYCAQKRLLISNLEETSAARGETAYTVSISNRPALYFSFNSSDILTVREIIP